MNEANLKPKLCDLLGICLVAMLFILVGATAMYFSLNEYCSRKHIIDHTLGMKCKSYPLEPNRIKEYEVFSGGMGNIVFDYNDGVRGATSHDDDRIPEGFLDLPQCKRVVTLIRKQIKKLHQLDHLPPAPPPQEKSFAGVIQDRLQGIKVEKDTE